VVRSKDYYSICDVKRQVPTGPNPAQSPDPVPEVARSNDNKFDREIKRKVPTGPNPAQSPDPVPIVASSNNYNFNYVIKRQVPTGPNPDNHLIRFLKWQDQMITTPFVMSKGKF